MLARKVVYQAPLLATIPSRLTRLNGADAVWEVSCLPLPLTSAELWPLPESVQDTSILVA